MHFSKMEDSSFSEKTLRVEAAAKEVLQGLKDLRVMMAKQSGLYPSADLSSSERQDLPEVDQARITIGQQEKKRWERVKPHLMQSKIKSWTKNAFKHAKDQTKTHSRDDIHVTALHTATEMSADSELPSKKSGWKLRSPLARRSAPKENAAQAAEIEKLKQALNDLDSAMPQDQLSLEEIERMKSEIRHLEEFKVAATRFAQEKLESQPKLRTLEEENKSLKDEKQRLEPLTQVGVAVRCRFFETFKRETDPQSKEDVAIVRNGNTHHGNVAADAALFSFKALDRVKYERLFDAIYQIGTPDKYHGRYLSARATDMINFRGTVEAAVHHPDASLYGRFSALEKKCRALLSVGSGPLSTVISTIDSDKINQKHCMQMQEMAAQIRNQARRGKCSGSIPRSAKQLEKRTQEEQRLALTVFNTAADTEEIPGALTRPEISEEKTKRRRKRKRMGAFVQAKLEALEEKEKQIQVVMVEEEKPKEPPVRVDIGQLARVKVVIPGFFGAISHILGYGE